MGWSALQPPTAYYTQITSLQSAGEESVSSGVRAGASANVINGAFFLADGSTNDSGNISVPTGMEEARELIGFGDWRTADAAAMGAGFTYGIRSTSPFVGYIQSSNKQNDPVTGVSSRVTVEIRENIASFDSTAAATALPGLPDALTGLVFGVDYGPNPITGEIVRYSGTTGTFSSWTGTMNVPDTPWQPFVTRTSSSSTEAWHIAFMATGFIGPADVPAGVPTQFFQAADGTVLTQWYFDHSLGSTQQASVPLADVASPKFTMVTMPGHMISDHFTASDYAPPSSGGLGLSFSDTNQAFISQMFVGHTEFPLVAVYLTPTWQYWIPDTTAPPLRLNQRDDGAGATAGHARLIKSQPNGAQSGQAATAPRIGTNNIYDPGF